MDTGEGVFAPINEKVFEEIEALQANAGQRGFGVFRVGEVVELKGSRFKVHKIHRNRMMLKLLPKDKGSDGLQ